MTFFTRRVSKMSSHKRICCLKRRDNKIKRSSLVVLEDEREVTIGRALDCTLQLESVLISRKHAIFHKGLDDTWTVTDNKSSNGIAVNGQKIKPCVPHALKDGDEIVLAVPPKKDIVPEFVFTYHTNLKVKQVAISDSTVGHVSSSQDSQQHSVPTQKRKRCNDSDTEPSSSTHLSSPRKAMKSPAKRLCQKPDVVSPSLEIRKQMEEQRLEAEKKFKEQEEKLAKLQALLQEKDKTQEKMAEELKEKEQQMKAELQKQQEQLEAEKVRMEEEIKNAYEKKIQESEETLLERLNGEKSVLMEERQRLEKQLQQEMENKLQERDKHLQEELVKQKDKLDKIIENKELEQKMLESQLNDVQRENMKTQEQALKAKEDVLANFAELMETELQCSICSELFVEATSLNCSHSYCAYCIEQWMKVKKECPNCRAPITSHLRSIVLDSYIDSMLAHLSEEMKKKRKELVQSRKEERKKQEAANAGRGRGGRGRGRTRGRGGARGRRRGRSGQDAVANDPVPIVIQSDEEVDSSEVNIGAEVEISDSSESGDDSNDDDPFNESDSLSSEDGDMGAYYGGYGRCYICDRRGHWANGCPYR